MLAIKKWGQTVGAGLGRWLVPALVATAWLSGCTPPGPRHLEEGEQLIGEGRPAEAVVPLRQAIVELATNAVACAQAWNHLGLAYHYSDQPALADGAYQTALSKNFNLVAARFNRGCLLLEQNQIAGAINELTTYTAHQPQHLEGWLKLGAAQLRARHLEGAERSFGQVLKLQPNHPAALNGLGLAHVLRRQPRDAYADFQAALKSQPDFAAALLNQGVVAQQYLNDRALALQKYNAYLQYTTSGPTVLSVTALATQLQSELRPASPLLAPGLLTTPVAPPPAQAAAVKTNAEPPAAKPATAAAVPLPVVDKPTVAATNTPATNVVTAKPEPAPHPITLPKPPPPAAPAATSTVARAQAPVVTPPPSATTPTNPPAQPKPSPARPVVADKPLESVRLDQEPEVKPGTDFAPPTVSRPSPPPPKPSPAAPATNVVVTAPTPPPPATNTIPVTVPQVSKPAAEPPSAPATPPQVIAQPLPPPVTPARAVEVPLESAPPPAKPAPATADTPEKKGLVQRLNPLVWFGKEDKASAPPEKPARTQTAPSRPAGSVTAGPASASPAPAIRAFSRYRYRHPAIPTPGNAPEALRLVTLGAQAQQANRLADAIQGYQKATEADPACFEAHYNLGVAAYEAGYWDLALTSGEKALVLRPQDTQARFNFALVLQRADYPLDAANEYETILRARPSDTNTWYALANLYANRLGETAKARESYRKVLELDPRFNQAGMIQDWLNAHP